MLKASVGTREWRWETMPSNAITTTSQLKNLMDKIASAMTNVDPGAETQTLGQLECTVIRSVYIVTDLHMLEDTSDGFVETWSFLKDSVQDMEVMVAKQSSSGLPNLEMAAAVSMVASSIGGSFFSLLTPAAKMSINSIEHCINIWNVENVI